MIGLPNGDLCFRRCGPRHQASYLRQRTKQRTLLLIPRQLSLRRDEVGDGGGGGNDNDDDDDNDTCRMMPQSRFRSTRHFLVTGLFSGCGGLT